MEETLFIILFVIIIIIIISKYNKNKDVSIVKSTIDNREYRVLKSDNEIEAANLLAIINKGRNCPKLNHNKINKIIGK